MSRPPRSKMISSSPTCTRRRTAPRTWRAALTCLRRREAPSMWRAAQWREEACGVWTEGNLGGRNGSPAWRCIDGSLVVSVTYIFTRINKCKSFKLFSWLHRTNSLTVEKEGDHLIWIWLYCLQAIDIRSCRSGITSCVVFKTFSGEIWLLH